MFVEYSASRFERIFNLFPSVPHLQLSNQERLGVPKGISYASPVWAL